MSESKFKVGDRVYAEGPGWGTVANIYDTYANNQHPLGIKFDSAHEGSGYFFCTLDGRLYKSWEPTLLTKEEAIEKGISLPCRFKIGDRVLVNKNEWGEVTDIIYTPAPNLLRILFPTGSFAAYNTDSILLKTEEEAKEEGFTYCAIENLKAVLVYRWEKILDQKENQPPYTKENQIVIQQSSYLAPKGSWLERDGWTIVPGSERKIDSKTLKDVPNETL